MRHVVAPASPRKVPSRDMTLQRIPLIVWSSNGEFLRSEASPPHAPKLSHPFRGINSIYGPLFARAPATARGDRTDERAGKCLPSSRLCSSLSNVSPFSRGHTACGRVDGNFTRVTIRVRARANKRRGRGAGRSADRRDDRDAPCLPGIALY
jgi:hypothetical protein